ncbi:MAG: FAD-dependent oxidoreductase [Proteobacteria bacterium]|nr:FAD-dependent oxidoreductase [Pseudomonadota bacterium]
MPKNVVIVGAGHAAGQAVVTLRQKGYDGKIILIGAEEYYPYQRPPLSKKFLAGELAAERLYVKPPSFYDHPDIELHLGTTVTRIDLAGKTVIDTDGNSYTYENLIIATGSRVRKLEVPGTGLACVYYLRDINDVTAMHEHMHEGKRLVIIGAGYIGLEVAAVANSKGLAVTVIEMAERVMSRVVSEQVSAFYESEHRQHGVNLMLSTGLAGFSGSDSVEQVDLTDGTSVAADFVLIGIGVVPNVDLARGAGLDVDNGIRVDDRCKTSDASAYAIGDCTNHPNSLLGQRLRLECVHNALEQAKTAARNICGDDLAYAQVPWFWSDQYDLKLQIAGISGGFDQTVLRGDPASRAFSCLYLRDGQLIAIDSINSPRDFMQSKALIGDHAVISPYVLTNTDLELKDMT